MILARLTSIECAKLPRCGTCWEKVAEKINELHSKACSAMSIGGRQAEKRGRRIPKSVHELAETLRAKDEMRKRQENKRASELSAPGSRVCLDVLCGWRTGNEGGR